MAHAHKNHSESIFINGGGDGDANPTTFHDFLGKKCQGQAPAPDPPPEVSLSASATSDLGSERQARSHLEGMTFYGLRSNAAAMAASSSSHKRSNADSFAVSLRERFPPAQMDSQDSPLLTKLLRYSGGERQHEEESLFGKHQMKPLSSPSFISQPKWGRASAAAAAGLTPGPLLHNPPRAAFCYQAPGNSLKDGNASMSLLSQIAADEGSRTGIKRRFLSSNNAAPPGRQPAGVLIRSGKQMASNPEPDPAATLSQQGSEPDCRQMTVFYGGQAHVFDNVPPNKADVIMALAGSSGGSWSTIYKQNSFLAPLAVREVAISGSGNEGVSVVRELQGMMQMHSSEKGGTSQV